MFVSAELTGSYITEDAVRSYTVTAGATFVSPAITVADAVKFTTYINVPSNHTWSATVRWRSDQFANPTTLVASAANGNKLPDLVEVKATSCQLAITNGDTVDRVYNVYIIRQKPVK